MNEKPCQSSLKFPTICFLKLKLSFNFIPAGLGQEGGKTGKVSRRRRRRRKKKTAGRA